jgi:uncharacterized membrane protein
LGFENQYGAKAMLDDVHKWQEQGLIEVEDAAVASAGPNGQVDIRRPTAPRTASSPCAAGA